MPSRIIRAALLRSDKFLGLPDNTARVCYVATLLEVDDFGNMEASPAALARFWRDFGVDSIEKAAKTATLLVDQDLIRFYEFEGKRYLHVPRFRQRKRYVKLACPQSPFEEEDQQKQRIKLAKDGLKTV